MSSVLQKCTARRIKNKTKRIQAGISDDDLARIEKLADALNANDDASFRLRDEIESILAAQPASDTEDPRSASSRMTIRH